MVDSNFVAALVQWARLSDENLAVLTSDFSSLYFQIQQGQGKQQTSISVPEYSASWSQSITVEDYFSALSRAIAILSNSQMIWKRTVSRVFV